MIDFHSHILPGIDDGSDCVETSLAMLRESYRQGVDVICATSHFYADEENPASFLANRAEAYDRLQEAIGDRPGFPKILLGAEILYFPGISVADEVRNLCMECTPFLLIEPPMMPWSDTMLDEIESCVQSLHCLPVIAHIDGYMRILNDYTLFDRVRDRRLLIQVNASFFLHRSSIDLALSSLEAGDFHFIGSDCHNMENRAPNLGYAAQVIRENGGEESFQRLHAHLYKILKIEQEPEIHWE